MRWIAGPLAFTLALAGIVQSAAAQEPNRLRPDERQRPAPADRRTGPAVDPSIDDPKAVEQQDLATRCRPPGAPTSAAGRAGLPSPAKTESDSGGDCILPSTGQPLGAKAVDKLSEPKRRRWLRPSKEWRPPGVAVFVPVSRIQHSPAGADGARTTPPRSRTAFDRPSRRLELRQLPDQPEAVSPEPIGVAAPRRASPCPRRWPALAARASARRPP